MTVADHLRLDPIACDGRGNCQELLPEMIRADRWGYPVVDKGPVPAHLAAQARRTVDLCPLLALRLERAAELS